jgi:hypothetical protein
MNTTNPTRRTLQFDEFQFVDNDRRQPVDDNFEEESLNDDSDVAEIEKIERIIRESAKFI